MILAMTTRYHFIITINWQLYEKRPHGTHQGHWDAPECGGSREAAFVQIFGEACRRYEIEPAKASVVLFQLEPDAL